MIIPFLAITASSHCYSLGRTVAYEEIKGHLFGTIRKVTVCGRFAHQNEIGEVRLIETDTYGGNMIFIDSVKLGGSGLELLHGVSIEETNNDHMELRIENLACTDLGENQIQVMGQVNGTGHSDARKYDFIIRYTAHEGSYEYSESANTRSTTF